MQKLSLSHANTLSLSLSVCLQYPTKLEKSLLLTESGQPQAPALWILNLPYVFQKVCAQPWPCLPQLCERPMGVSRKIKSTCFQSSNTCQMEATRNEQRGSLRGRSQGEEEQLCQGEGGHAGMWVKTQLKGVNVIKREEPG